MRLISAKGLDLLKNFEQCKLSSYKDIGGIWTIGWGHTGTEVVADLVISQAHADKLLDNDLKRFEDAVNNGVTSSITQHEFDALVCFFYNVGNRAALGSTLLKDLNHNDYNKASKDFLDWDKVQGHVVYGLLRRRKAESDLFLTDDLI